MTSNKRNRVEIHELMKIPVVCGKWYSIIFWRVPQNYQ